jgi:hypothetical protein
VAQKFPSKFGKRLSPSELKQFRAYVSQLKKRGLIRKGISAKTARPVQISGGKTLQEIVNKSLKTIPPKEAPKLLPIRTPISVRDFPVKHKSLALVLSDLEANAKEINALKRPGEYFAWEVDGIKSYGIFADIELLARELGESAGIQQLFHKRSQGTTFINKLKIVRWNKRAKDWKPAPQKAPWLKKKRKRRG